MAGLNLKTTYKDDVLDTTVNTQRKFKMIQNEDGTVSFEDVTIYSQEGDSFGALDINATNEAICEVNNNLAKQSEQLTELYNGLDSKMDDVTLTANRVLVSDSNGKLSVSSITSTLLGYLSGLTGNIQTQLNNKSPVLTTKVINRNWSIGASAYSTTIEFNIAKSGYTPIGVVGFDIGATGVVAVGACDLSSETVARIGIAHSLDVVYAHSGTASIRILYLKN